MTLLLTEEQAAEILHVSPRTLRDLRRHGAIRYVAITARKVGYRPEDCEEYVASRLRVESPAAPMGPPKPKRGKRAASTNGVVVPFSQRMRRA
jgi:hypothetical protein